jgi:iron complex outermembrane receptor protein
MKLKDLSRFSTSRMVVAFVAAAGGVPSLAQAGAADAAAQSSASSESSGSQVEEIVVTAQFREQNLQKTPIAITAVSGAMLQARSQTNIQQVASQAPNVTLRTGAANFGPSLVASIRGVGQTDFNPALEPGVGLYVDDVYYATLTGSIFDLLDLDRVEILRGPQGTLAGRNSIGGAIKLYSKRPTGDGSGMAQATYGSRNRIDLRASMDFNLAKDLDVRIAGVSKQQRGYVTVLDFGCANPPGSALNPAVGGVSPTLPVGGKSCVVDHQGEVNYQALRAQLRYHPSDAVDINIIGDYTHDKRSPAASVLTYADNPRTGAIRGDATAVPFDSRFLCGKYCNYASFIMPADPANGFPTSTTRSPLTRFDGYGFSAQGDFELSDTLKLTSITAYRHYSSTFTGDDDLSPLPVTSSRSDLRFRFFSQELRLNGAFADNLVEYTLGAYYSSQKSIYGTVQDLRWAGLQFASLGDQVPAHSKAAFAHVAVHPTDQLTLTGGIRYTDEDKDYTYSRRFADGTVGQPLVGALDGVVGKYQKKRVDYRANVQYQWTDSLMTYAQFSTGFKGGGINPRPYFASQVQPFGPETIKAYEVGLKTDAFDHKARFNLSAFYNDYKDMQLTLLSCPQFNPTPPGPGVPGLPCALPANAGDAHVKGIELETSLRPVDGLLIDGSVSYLDFHYTRIDPSAGGVGGVLLGYVAPTTSKWKWSVGAQYGIDLGNSGTLTPRIDAAYQSANFTNAVNAPTNRVPAYTVANARLSWQNPGKDIEISGEVTNLFDKYYFINTFDLAASAGYASAVPGRPREWAITVTKHF